MVLEMVEVLLLLLLVDLSWLHAGGGLAQAFRQLGAAVGVAIRLGAL